jgi:hypothetical protein
MFAVRISDMFSLKQQFEEHQRLEAEHAELVAELEAAVSPEFAEQVEKILTTHENRRASVAGGFLATMTPHRTPRSARTSSSVSGVPLPE